MFSIQERLGIASEPIMGAGWQWACMLRSSIPAIVKSFDAEKQTCVVQIAIMEDVLLPPAPTPSNPNPDTTTNVPTDIAIKPLEDVPILMMRVPGWSITLPITEGTECLLIFSDACIDGWWQTGDVSVQYDRRRHDLNDAIALFGPWSQKNALSNYSTDSLQLRSDDGSVVIDMKTEQITIQAPLTQIASQGGTPLALVNQNLITWITGTLIPALAAKGITVSPPPANCVTTTVKGQ